MLKFPFFSCSRCLVLLLFHLFWCVCVCFACSVTFIVLLLAIDFSASEKSWQKQDTKKLLTIQDNFCLQGKKGLGTSVNIVCMEKNSTNSRAHWSAKANHIAHTQNTKKKQRIKWNFPLRFSVFKCIRATISISFVMERNHVQRVQFSWPPFYLSVTNV